MIRKIEVVLGTNGGVAEVRYQEEKIPVYTANFGDILATALNRRLLCGDMWIWPEPHEVSEARVRLIQILAGERQDLEGEKGIISRLLLGYGNRTGILVPSVDEEGTPFKYLFGMRIEVSSQSFTSLVALAMGIKLGSDSKDGYDCPPQVFRAEAGKGFLERLEANVWPDDTEKQAISWLADQCENFGFAI